MVCRALICLLLSGALVTGLSDAFSGTVTDASRIQAAIASAAAGDVITVACDIPALTIRKIHGAKEHPITLKADTVLGRKVNGTLTLQECSNLRLEGFLFQGFSSNALKIIASSRIVVACNKFDFSGVASANGIFTSCAGGPVEDIEIVHNEFNHHDAPGTWTGSYIKTWFNGADVARRLWIHHNYFANVAPKVDRPGTANPFDGDSDRETIIFGEGASQNIETNHLIERNFFENCDGEDEMISFKTSKNIFRHNTARNCMGSVHIRFGHGTEVYGNLFTGDLVTDFSDVAYTAGANHETSGVVIYGIDHKVYNNYFENLTGGRTSKHRLPLVLDGGDTDETTGNDHPRPRRVVVSHNTFVNCQFGIGVGLNYTLPPQQCEISDNLVNGVARQAFLVGTASLADSSCIYTANLVWLHEPAICGISQGLIKADPLLVVLDTGGLAARVPGPGSPAINAARGWCVKEDFLGSARDGVPDIGACESGAVVRIPPIQRAQVGPRADG